MIKIQSWCKATENDIVHWAEQVVLPELQEEDIVMLAKFLARYGHLARAGFLMFKFDPGSRRWLITLTRDGAKAWKRRAKRTVH